MFVAIFETWLGTQTALPFLVKHSATASPGRELHNPQMLPLFRPELTNQRADILKFWIRMAKDLTKRPATTKALKDWWAQTKMLSPFAQNAFNQAHFRALSDASSCWVVKAAHGHVAHTGKKIVESHIQKLCNLAAIAEEAIEAVKIKSPALFSTSWQNKFWDFKLDPNVEKV